MKKQPREEVSHCSASTNTSKTLQIASDLLWFLELTMIAIF